MLSILFSAEELDFARNAESGTSVGGLKVLISLQITYSAGNDFVVTYAESESLESFGEARNRLISRSSFRNESKRSSGPG